MPEKIRDHKQNVTLLVKDRTRKVNGESLIFVLCSSPQKIRSRLYLYILKGGKDRRPVAYHGGWIRGERCLR